MKIFSGLFKREQKIRYLPLATTGTTTMMNLLKKGYTMLAGEPMIASLEYRQMWEIDDHKKTFREINVQKSGEIK